MNQQFDEDQNMPEDTLKSHKQTSDPLREAWKQVENIGQTLYSREEMLLWFESTTKH